MSRARSDARELDERCSPGQLGGHGGGPGAGRDAAAIKRGLNLGQRRLRDAPLGEFLLRQRQGKCHAAQTHLAGSGPAFLRLIPSLSSSLRRIASNLYNVETEFHVQSFPGRVGGARARSGSPG